MTAVAHGIDSLTITFPSRVASLERLLDQVVIQSRNSPAGVRAVLGPFMVSQHRPGAFIELRRNPNYWKKDKTGRKLPHLDSIRFDIAANKDIELLRFNRGDYHLIENLDADAFDGLLRKPDVLAVNAGATTDVEMVWFNQVAAAPIRDAKKQWFQSRLFRQAIAQAVNREDMVRLAYRGHAKPAVGPVPAWSAWYKRDLAPLTYNPAEAKRKLSSAGFYYKEETLHDAQGNPVMFSLITNAGNKARARLAALMQEDLKKIGIRLNITALDFPSLLERIGKTFDYDACLLGLVNVDQDPTRR